MRIGGCAAGNCAFRSSSLLSRASVLKGIPFAILSYASFSCGDAVVKHLGGRVGIFEMGFFIVLFSIIPVVLFKPGHERWSMAFAMKRPRLVHLRGAVGVFGSIMSVYAFTRLPLAEAYALIFLIPFFTTVLSVVILREPVGWRRWAAVLAGFAGILLVIKPGFREIGLAHAAGVGVALTGGFTVVLLRKLSGTESRTALMSIVIVYALAVNFALMLPNFAMPSAIDMAWLVAVGCLSGIGHALLIRATTLSPANHVAPVQYSQIIWAVVLGAIFFAEIPDPLTFAGLGIVAASGLFTFFREAQFGWWRKTPVMRDRP